MNYLKTINTSFLIINFMNSKIYVSEKFRKKNVPIVMIIIVFLAIKIMNKDY